MKTPTQLLEQHFGFDTFLEGQEKVIDSLLAGHSAAAVFPTGGGKSLCYQLPALAFSGMTLVVSPLIALMKDQIDALASRGHRALRLDSSLDADEYRAAMEDLRSGSVKLVYVAPERFNNERFRESINGLEVSLFAVDEAHCISEWGHNFRPDYLKLVRYAEDCKAKRVLALTATATEPVLEDICRSFDIAPEHAVRTRFYRPNLALTTTPTNDRHRFDLLQQRLTERPRGATIVYVTKQKAAEEVAERLTKAGLHARAYHAGKKPEERNQVQDWFFAESRPIVVATIAFGMGIDKPDIRSVYHYNLAKSLENYSQEIGRAGRDGEPSHCELFACADDLTDLENFVYGDTPSERSIRVVLEGLFSSDGSHGGEPSQVDLSLYQVSFDSDMRQLVLRTVLTYLELSGLLEARTPYYSKYEFQPKVSSQEILAHFDGDRRAFVQHLLRHSEKRRTWFTLDVDGACRSYPAPRGRALRALEYFEQQGWIELRALGIRHRYRILERPASIEELVIDLTARFAKRETAEILRLQQVLDYARASECLAQTLSAHFGEKLDQPCGRCTWCEGSGEGTNIPERTRVAVDDQRLASAVALRSDHPEELADARALTRFLCGISSPRTSRAKLTRHQLYGTFSGASFVRVLEKVEAALG